MPITDFLRLDLSGFEYIKPIANELKEPPSAVLIGKLGDGFSNAVSCIYLYYTGKSC